MSLDDRNHSAPPTGLRRRPRHAGVLLGLAALLLAIRFGGCGRAGEDPGTTLHLAEIARLRTATETLRLDFGDDAIRQHLVAGWSWDANARKRGEKSVWAVGESSSLTFRAFEVRDLEMVFSCRPFRVPDEARQAVTFLFNGIEVGNVELKPGRRQYRLTVPAAALVSGENHLTLRYRYHRSPAEVEGGADSRTLAVAWFEILLHEPGVGTERAEEVEPSGEVLSVGLGARQDYYFRLSEGSRLELRDLQVTGATAARLRVEVETASDDAPETSTRTLTVERGDRVDLPLAPERAAVMRLSLRGEALGGARPGARLTLGRAALVLPEPVPDEPPAPSATLADGSRPNILIYVIDTLRADRLGPYGYDRPVSPNIDELAAEGVVVERALAHAPWTRPSMVSMITGQWPYAHDINTKRSSLPEEMTTLAELLRDGGYRTVGFISNPQVGKAFGLDQGYDEYYELREKGDAYLRDSSRLLYESVAGWLDKNPPGDEPLLLYVHTIDPHAPYTPTGEFRERFAAGVADPELSPELLEELAELRKRLGRHSYFHEGDLHLGSMPWMIGLEEGRLETTESQTEDLLDLYDAEIAINDHWFGVLVDRLREEGLWRDTLVILLSDHGEEFGEHGHWEHSRTLYSAALEVPLIFKLPAGWERPEGGRIATAQLIDVLPTALAVAGIEPPVRAEGEALFSSTSDGSQTRPSFSFVNRRGVKATGVVDGRWKLIRTVDGEPPLELYDLETDPGEGRNLADERPLMVGYLLDLIWQQEIVYGPTTASGTAVVDDETRRRLEALGYI